MGPRWGFSLGSVVKNQPANAGDAGNMGSVPGLGRSSGGGHGHPLQYSCLGNLVDRGAWWATYSPWGHKKSQLSDYTTTTALNL